MSRSSPTTSCTQTMHLVFRRGLVSGVVIAIIAIATGCASLRPSDDPSASQSASDVARAQVEDAALDAEFSLIGAYERRGMTDDAERLRRKFEDLPGFESAVRASRVERLLQDQDRATVESYRRLSQLRVDHPDAVDDSEYADFLISFIEDYRGSEPRLSAMKELAKLRPKHALVSQTEFVAERLAVAYRHLTAGRFEAAEEMLTRLNSQIEAGKLEVDSSTRTAVYLSLARLYGAQGENEAFRAASTRYLLHDTPTISKVQSIISLFNQFDRSKAGLAWLEAVEETLLAHRALQERDPARERVLDMRRFYLERANFRADHNDHVDNVIADLRRFLDGSDDRNDYITAYEVVRAMGHGMRGEEFLEGVREHAESSHDLAWLFKAYARLGLRERATEIAGEFVAQGDNAAAYARVASWMKEARWPDEARTWLKKAFDRDRDNWLYATQMYRLARETGHTSLADSAARRLESLAHKKPGRLLSVAHEFETHGELQRAADALRKAMNDESSHVGIARRLLRIEAQLGRPQNAVEAAREMLERPYISANQWRQVAREIEQVAGLEYALPLFEEAANRGSTIHVAAYVTALHRAGDFAAVDERVREFLEAHATAPSSIQLLANNIELDDLPGKTRSAILEAYADSRGTDAALARRAVEYFCERGQWADALDYLKYQFKRGNRDILDIRLAPYRRPHGRNGLDLALVGELVVEMESTMEPASELDDGELEFAAMLHNYYAHSVTYSSTDGTLQAVIASRRSAREYFRELVARVERESSFDKELVRKLLKYHHYALAEEYLVASRTSLEPRDFWERYTHLLEAQGRFGAASQTAFRVLELTEPTNRAEWAMARVDAALTYGDLNVAEDFLTRAAAAAEHPESSPRTRTRVQQEGYSKLAHIMLQRGQLTEFLDATDGYIQHIEDDARLATPGKTPAIDALARYGYHDAYVRRLQRIASKNPDQPSWQLALAEAHAEAGDSERALELFESFDDDASRTQSLAEVFFELGQPEYALDVLDAFNGLDVEPRVTHLLLRCKIHLLRGDIDDAARVLAELTNASRGTYGSQRVRPESIEELRHVIRKTGMREPLLAALDSKDEADAVGFLGWNSVDNETIDFAVDLSDEEELLTDTNAPSHGLTLIERGLGWYVAGKLLDKSRSPSVDSVGREPYRHVSDELVRLGILTDYLDQSAQSTITPDDLARLYMLDGREDELRKQLDTTFRGARTWQAAASIGELQTALDAITPRDRWWNALSNRGLERTLDLQTTAALMGYGPRFEALGTHPGKTLFPGDASELLRTARLISSGQAHDVLDDIRNHLSDISARQRGPYRPHGSATAAEFDRLSTLAVMGYHAEVAALLARTRFEGVPASVHHQMLYLNMNADIPADATLMPDRLLSVYLHALSASNRTPVARRLLDEHPKQPGHQLSRSPLSGSRLLVASRENDTETMRPYVDFGLLTNASMSSSVRAAKLVALQIPDFDAAARSLYFSRPSRRGIRDAQTWSLLMSLGHEELANRGLPPGVAPWLNAQSDAQPQVWPVFGESDSFRERMQGLKVAFPADPYPELALVITDLASDPTDGGRERLERYVEAHGDHTRNIAVLVKTLAEHDMHVELAAFVTPAVEPNTLPILTNRILLEAALRTDRRAQARALTNLVLTRLPNPAYVASDVAHLALDHGQIDLARRLIEHAESLGALPYTRLARARLELRSETPATGADIAAQLLDERALAPDDHCSLLIEAIHAGQMDLRDRIATRQMRLPTSSSQDVAGEIVRGFANCLIDANLAREGVELIEHHVPFLLGNSEHVLNSSVSVEVARLLRHAGRLEQARNLAQSAIRSRELFRYGRIPRSISREYARIELAAGHPDAALDHIRNAMWTPSPDDLGEALYLRARAHLARGESALARQYLIVAYGTHSKQERRTRIRLMLLSLPPAD